MTQRVSHKPIHRFTTGRCSTCSDNRGGGGGLGWEEGEGWDGRRERGGMEGGEGVGWKEGKGLDGRSE